MTGFGVGTWKSAPDSSSTDLVEGPRRRSRRRAAEGRQPARDQDRAATDPL